MADHHVQRFWHSPEVEPTLDDDGFLVDPIAHHAWVASVEAVDPGSIPLCVVLLGEPGTGKTVVLDECQSEAAKARRRTLPIDLRMVDSTDAFRDVVFGNPEYQKWLNDDSTLELFLDGLDECLTEAPKIAAVLVERLPKLPIERLRLRIGCRSADWPRLLENRCKVLWEDGFAARQLAPLRAEDVSAIAAADELDGEAFLMQVRQRSVGPLAARPITLKLLLATFGQHFALPGSRTDLYREALVLLCQEQNLSRIASRQVSRYAPAQLLACASRIAAALVLCNRYGIAETPQVDHPGLPVITIDEVAGGVEVANHEEFAVDREVVRDTLATGLFEPAGGGVHTFAHRTFGEYLAASCLAREDFTLDQIFSLITTSADDRVVPQMRDVAAWIAELRVDVRHELIRRDPLTAARMEVAGCSDRDRERLVTSLLEAECHGTLPRFELRRDFIKLAHPELAQQLRTHVQSHGVSDVVIDIVAAANLLEVGEYLVDAVADLSAPSDVRMKAAQALLRLKDPSTFKRVKALLPDRIGDDPHDEIRGCLLLLLWPANLEAETLFASLVEPDDFHFVGRYAEFLREPVLQGINAQTLRTGLAWVATQTDDFPDRFHDLVATILNLGARIWRAGYDEEDLFPQALLGQLRADSGVLDTAALPELAELLNDVEARHRLVETLIPQLGERNGHLLIPNARFLLVREDDMQWLIEKGRAAEPDAKRRAWAELMNRVITAEASVEIIDMILSEAQTNSLVAEEFRWAIQPVALDSKQARDAREIHRLRTRTLAREPKIDAVAKLRRLVDQLGAIDEEWWAKAMTLAFDRLEWNVRAAIDQLVELTSNSNHTSLCVAAERFLTSADAPAEDQIEPRSIQYWSAFAFGAMVLLAERDPSRFEALSVDVIRRWIPSILAEAAFDSGLDAAALDALRAKLPPDDVARVIERLIRIENDSHPDGLHNSLRAAERLPSVQVTKVLIGYLDDTSLHDGAFGSLLGALLKHGVPNARVRCENLVRSATAAGEADKRALAAAKNLVAHSPDASWSLIWAFVRAVGKEGQKLLESQLGFDRMNEFLAKLKDSEIADIVIWIFENRAKEDLDIESHIGMAIISVLNVLLKRGRVEELRRIQAAFPNRIHDQFILMAQEERQKESWNPPTPEQLFALGTDRRKRVVQNAERLVDVVIESLQRLQAQLHGEDPTAKYLWDGDKPKDEGAIRDWIRKFLNDDDALPRLITNKEVEVFDRFYTDIKIEAIGRGARRDLDPKLVVTIEVKGCWHDELKTAMETQLVEKYLRGSGSPYGIYLVARFGASAWTDEDGRKKKCHSWSREEMEEYLSRQAENLREQGFFITLVVLDCAIPKKK